MKSLKEMMFPFGGKRARTMESVNFFFFFFVDYALLLRCNTSHSCVFLSSLVCQQNEAVVQTEKSSFVYQNEISRQFAQKINVSSFSWSKIYSSSCKLAKITSIHYILRKDTE